MPPSSSPLAEYSLPDLQAARYYLLYLTSLSALLLPLFSECELGGPRAGVGAVGGVGGLCGVGFAGRAGWDDGYWDGGEEWCGAKAWGERSEKGGFA